MRIPSFILKCGVAIGGREEVAHRVVQEEAGKRIIGGAVTQENIGTHAWIGNARDKNRIRIFAANQQQ